MNDRVLHLCCGRGGSLWAGAILGWNSVAAVDHDAWRIECLRRESAAGWWPGLQTVCTDIGANWHAGIHGRVDGIAAGFSCRDISSAGGGAGLDGASTGPTYRGVLAAIDYFRPSWVFLENSPLIRTRGRARVTADIVARNLCWRDGIIAASDCGAPHLRERWFCLAANADYLRKLQSRGSEPDQRGRIGDGAAPSPANPSSERFYERSTVGGSEAIGIQGNDQSQGGAEDRDAYSRMLPYGSVAGIRPQSDTYATGIGGWATEPNVDRMVHGVADGVKRIAALGDAWVPIQAAAAFKVLTGSGE